jgi:ribonuclease D
VPREPKATEFLIIERSDQLVEYCTRARSHARFAFDTEFVMEDRYEPEVCLIQLATQDGVALIDPYLKIDLEPVWKLICDGQVETIVHAGQEDLALCVQHTGQFPQNIFDVQIAAGFVGLDYPVSLQKLIQAVLQIRLHKAKTLTDWRRRPLTAAQLRYAAEDVCHLLAVRQKLGERLKRLDRAEWAAEEFAHFQRPDAYGRADGQFSPRVKGITTLRGRSMSIARQLLTWRDELARKLNRPARAVLKDHLLIEISRLELTSFSEIRDLRGLNISDKQIQNLAKVVELAKTLPPEKSEPAAQADFETPQETILIALATAVIRSYCIEHELAYGLVATKKAIRDLIRHRTSRRSRKPEDVDLLNGWRAKTVGALLDELLAGRRTVRVKSVGRDLFLDVWKPGENARGQVSA